MEIDVTKCENYKLAFSGYICADPNLRNDCSLNNNCKFKQLQRYKQAIRDIKDIAEQQVPYINLDSAKTCMEVEFDYIGKAWNLELRMYNILQKIAECEEVNE